MDVRKLAETATTITIGWDPQVGQSGYVPLIDGNDKLTDGKRHPAYGPTAAGASSVRIGKPSGEANPATKYRYGVKLLGTLDEGHYDPTDTGNLSPIAPPQGQMQERTSAYLVRSYGTGLTQNIHVLRAPDFGVLVMEWPPKEWPARYVVRDWIAENVFEAPFDWEGFNEATGWLGQCVYAHRFVCRNAEWMGLFTGSRFVDSIVEDFQLLQQPWIGIYPEHVSARSTFRRFFAQSRKNANNVEWTYQDDYHHEFYEKLYGPTIAAGGRAGSAELKWYDGVFESTEGYASYLDAGTWGCEIAKDGYVKVIGTKGIRLPNVLANPNSPNVVVKENIDWDPRIPENQRVTYHSDPMGVYKTGRFAFGLGRGRIEGKRPHQRIRNWDATVAKIGFSRPA